MKKRKTLQDLTIKDNFLFGAVMRVEENCKGFLEMVLGFPIARVVVSKEKSIIYHPEYKGVRLDIYAEDENHTHYNVEMQVRKKKSLGKRSRYYHSQMGERYMIFEEMLKEEKLEGRLEDIVKLKNLHKMAARATSISTFEKETEEYFNSEK